MNGIHRDLSHAVTRFPEHAKALKGHFYGNHEFRNICEDYRICHEALAYWTRLEKEGREGPKEEYAALLKELETEMIEFLDKHS